MLELLLLSIALIGSLAAGLWDLKTTNIPDRLVILMIILGLAINGYESFVTNNFSLIYNSILFGSLFFVFSLVMYFTGQWGGGDGELLIAIGVLLPNLALDFFVNLFFIGAAFIILYSVIFAFRNNLTGKFLFSIKGYTKPMLILFFISAVASLILFSFFPILSVIPILIFLILPTFKFLKFIEKNFYKKIPTKKLQIDDMIGEDIPKLKIYKKQLRGLKKEEVQKIRKIKRYVIIREGIRFGLAFPINLIITLLFGNLIYLVLL